MTHAQFKICREKSLLILSHIIVCHDTHTQEVRRTNHSTPRVFSGNLRALRLFLIIFYFLFFLTMLLESLLRDVRSWTLDLNIYIYIYWNTNYPTCTRVFALASQNDHCVQICGICKSRICTIWSLLQGFFAKETYVFREPTNRSHPKCIATWGGYD